MNIHYEKKKKENIPTPEKKCFKYYIYISLLLIKKKYMFIFFCLVLWYLSILNKKNKKQKQKLIYQIHTNYIKTKEKIILKSVNSIDANS